jgi:hypothetical protein
VRFDARRPSRSGHRGRIGRAPRREGCPRDFIRQDPPSDEDVAHVVSRVEQRLTRLLSLARERQLGLARRLAHRIVEAQLVAIVEHVHQHGAHRLGHNGALTLRLARFVTHAAERG